jgi:hypothetical protein
MVTEAGSWNGLDMVGLLRVVSSGGSV